MRKYVHYLRTGSGSNHVEVQLGAKTTAINICSRWMGSGQKRYKLTCRHYAASGSFGLFVVTHVEGAIGDDAPLETIALDEEEMLLPLVIEYVVVPPSPVYVHEGSQLTVMRPLGYATWNDVFSLVLMVHDFEGRAQKSPLMDICDALDKKKFTEWTKETEAKQAAREREEAETSLQLWESILSGKKK